jgi:uncharacterized membrane protein YqhA
MKYILRPAITVIAVILILDALFLIGRGVQLTYQSYVDYFTNPGADRPFLHALEAVDMFFLALVFFIMAIGLVQLFVGEITLLRSVSFTWLKINDFTDLKLLLWHSFLVTILVLFMTHLVRVEDPGWEILILPVSILLLSIGAHLVKKH